MRETLTMSNVCSTENDASYLNLFYQRRGRRRRGQTIIRETLTMLNVCSTENDDIQV